MTDCYHWPAPNGWKVSVMLEETGLLEETGVPCTVKPVNIGAGDPLGQSTDELPSVSRWRDLIKSRPAPQRGVGPGGDPRRGGQHSDESRKILFGQSARSLRGQST